MEGTGVKPGNFQGLAVRAEKFMMDIVAAALNDYEPRKPQIDMLRACAGMIEKGGALLAEAGTGTGKTFAYLAPLLASGDRAVISTRTINLQEQIVSKDLRFLSGLKPFDYAIAKGRSNYLCLRRLNSFRASDERENEEYSELIRWASRTGTGDIEDYGPRRVLIWDKVCSDSDACKGSQCAFFPRCCYFTARGLWDKAQIIVANHALVGINALFDHDARLLPKADLLIIDEAHVLDSVLSDVAGLTLSNRGFEIIMSRLLKLDEKGAYRGLLSQTPELFQAVESLRAEMGLFWIKVKNAVKHRETIKGTFEFTGQLIRLADALEGLVGNMVSCTKGLFQEDDELEIKASIVKLKVFAEGMHAFTNGLDGFVRWADIEEKRIALRMSPVYPKDFMMQHILPEYRSVILASATLSVAGDFSFVTKVLGLVDAKTLSVPSPFDFGKQITVHVKKGINLKQPGSAAKLAGVIIEEASKKDGGVLVLFTSRESMQAAWAIANGPLQDMGLNPMVQGEMPNRLMLEKMRGSENSVIFGLDSFWEGVDVKGDSLKCLIIAKLPFEVPTEPVVKARTEEIELGGGNAFYEYSLPRAVLKFKQGLGRLIRSKNDSGRVIICDERIETMAYGRTFMESIPR
jgi:Rad3-related DNA helicase